MKKELIDIITKSSVEVIKNAGVTKEREFVDSKDTFVPKGIPYHIHYTSDKREYYMTSGEHETNSILIFKQGKPTDFKRYRNLVGKKSQQYLEETRSVPGELDYDKGFFTMYFARQANDVNAKIFEISKKDYDINTPFYIKTPLTLKITGERKNVILYNTKIILNKEIRGFRGLIDANISPLQFYRPIRNTKGNVQDRLKSYKQETPSSTSGGSSGGSSGGGGY
mgnify:CR=1 FL=1